MRRLACRTLVLCVGASGGAWAIWRWQRLRNTDRQHQMWTSKAEEEEDEDQVECSALPEELYKTRPCRWIVMKGRCCYGAKCDFAHSPEELRLPPPSYRVPDAPHWRGAAVAIGIIEQALFRDAPPLGTTDVVCNRCTCLGNPFATRRYLPDEERPPQDDDGWRPLEHEELCTAFDKYLSEVLDGSSREEDLVSTVMRIAHEGSLTIADTWLGLHLKRPDVLGAINELGWRIAGGERLRLLCHCRPHVRCHTEYLKAHLDLQATSAALTVTPAGDDVSDETQNMRVADLWPSFEGDGPRCAQCGRQGRALDPGDMRMYCAFCWMQYADDMKWRTANTTNFQKKGS